MRCSPMLLVVMCSTAVWSCERSTSSPAPPHSRSQSFPDVPAEKIIDLTHSFDESTIYWPTAEGFVLERGPAGETPQGYFYSANAMRLAEHGGTHIDAPIHFYRARQTVDQIPLDKLIGPGVVIDVTGQCDADRDYRITIADVEAWETQHGPLPDGAIVLLRTGFAGHWPDREKYLGTAERGEAAVGKLHFPGLHHETADWLAQHRKITCIGIDTASIDHGQSKTFAAHVLLFRASIPALENVANLDKLPPRGFTVFALPMKIAAGSGGPTRIVAILD